MVLSGVVVCISLNMRQHSTGIEDSSVRTPLWGFLSEDSSVRTPQWGLLGETLQRGLLSEDSSMRTTQWGVFIRVPGSGRSPRCVSVPGSSIVASCVLPLNKYQVPMFNLVRNVQYIVGGWVAKLVACLLPTAWKLSGFESRHPSKITPGRHK